MSARCPRQPSPEADNEPERSKLGHETLGDRTPIDEGSRRMRVYRSVLASSKAKVKSVLRPLLVAVHGPQPSLAPELWDLLFLNLIFLFNYVTLNLEYNKTPFCNGHQKER